MEQKECVIPFRKGGLGNQLFIVIAGYITSKVKNVPLYILNMHWQQHQKSTGDYNKSIFAKLGIHIPVDQSNMSIIAPWYTLYSQDGFSPWSPDTIPACSFPDTYFQYYPAILPYEEEVREILLKGLAPQREILQSVYTGSYAFLHVRRGEYLPISHIHYVQPVEYFEKAVAHLDAQCILIFSDDTAWVEEQEFFKSERFQIIRGLDELESLALMSLCTEGAICSNSTFSWWGAFLGAHGLRKKVIVPERWIDPNVFNTETWPTSPQGAKVPPLFPEEWIILS